LNNPISNRKVKMEVKKGGDPAYAVVAYSKRADYILFELDRKHRRNLMLPVHVKAPMGDFLKRMLK